MKLRRRGITQKKAKFEIKNTVAFIAALKTIGLSRREPASAGTSRGTSVIMTPTHEARRVTATILCKRPIFILSTWYRPQTVLDGCRVSWLLAVTGWTSCLVASYFVCLFVCLFVFGATAPLPSGPWPPHSRGF